MSKNGKMLALINYRLRLTLSDGRTLVGQMLAFDKHMNVVLADAEEWRTLKNRGKDGEVREQRRSLGLVILRGETLVSLSVEGPPPVTPEDRAKAAAARLAPGPGRGMAVGRGLPTGPVRGVGGPSAEAMQPQFPGMMGRGGMAPGFPGGQRPPLPPGGGGFPGGPPPPPPPGGFPGGGFPGAGFPGRGG